MDNICRDELFFKLYQQHFKHFSQNPIKYSTSNPFLDINYKINVNALVDKCREELSDIDQENEDPKIPIPLRQRAYVCVVEDDNTNVYLTNDNYIAYCAVEDKCMVHIALETCSRDGIQDQVRHCFNINHNGTVVEYWLHADLIPFCNPSEAESGIFSDDEDDSTGSVSGQEDKIDENDTGEDDDSDDDIIKGEWEIVESDSDDIDNWLNDPCLLKKYAGENNINIDGVEQTVTDVSREEYTLNSPEYDSENSGFSDSDIKTKLSSSEKQNFIQSPIQKFSKVSRNETQDFDVATSLDLTTSVNCTMPADVITKQIDVNVINSDLLVKTEDDLMSQNEVLSVESINSDDSLETCKDLTSDIKTENSANNWKSNKGGNKPGNITHLYNNTSAINIQFHFLFS